MYLFYVDESGTVESPGDRHFVIGCVGIFERQVYWISRELDDLQKRLLPDVDEPVEFHASAIIPGKEPWDRLEGFKERLNVVSEIYGIIANAHYPGVVLFAVAVDKARWNKDPVESSFEELCMRIEAYLKRRTDEGDENRALFIFDDSRFRQRFESLTRDFRTVGTRLGRPLRNIVDVPLFTTSRLTRGLQVADFVANAVWRRYEHSDGRSLDKILHRFDQSRGILHGLVHLTKDYARCHCPACLSRRAAKSV